VKYVVIHEDKKKPLLHSTVEILLQSNVNVLHLLEKLNAEPPFMGRKIM
jgi:hypothetical protein